MKRSTHTLTHTHTHTPLFLPCNLSFCLFFFFQLKLSWCIGQELRHKHREETCGHRVGKEREGWIERGAWTYIHSVQFSSVQSLSRVRLFATPWIAARQASLSITNSQSSLKLNVHRVSDAIQPSHPLSSPSPPAPNPSQHQSLFQWVNSSHELAKVLEFQL